MIVEPVAPPRAREVELRIAREPWELCAYHRLRRRVFCDEQRLFAGDDRDAIDGCATVLVAGHRIAGVVDDIVGGVRIWEASAGVWWGGRLVVEPDHRGAAGIATGLIRLAVTTACRRGATAFRAAVQVGNAALFEHLGWTALEAVELRGAPHVVMAADLARHRGAAS